MYSVVDKYSSYAPLEYQNQWLYSEPQEELITTVREKKNLRVQSARKAKVAVEETNIHADKELSDKENSSVLEGHSTPAKRRGRGRPPGSKNKRKKE